ncbi:MAG: hypothetical protein ACREDN_08170, partial [Aestuariivirga sp.]
MRFQLPPFAPRYRLFYGVMALTLLLALLLVFNPRAWPWLILPLLLVAWLSAQGLHYITPKKRSVLR